MKESNIPPEEESPSGHAQLIKELDNGARKIIKGIRNIYNALPLPEKEKARKHLSQAWKYLNLARQAAKDKKTEGECFRIFADEFNNASTKLDDTRKIFHSPKLQKEQERIDVLLKKIPKKYRGNKNITNGGCL